MHASTPSDDRLAPLRQRAQERAQRTVERTRAAILALRAQGTKVTAESIKQASRDLEPGFAGLSLQVIRRNPTAYALYRGAAEAFLAPAREKASSLKEWRRSRSRAGRRVPRAAYDRLESRPKKELVRRIRSLEHELEAERQQHAGLAYDKQILLARLLRLETENVLLRAEQRQPDH